MPLLRRNVKITVSFFIRPKVSVLKALSDKITAKEVAIANNIPIIQSSTKDLIDEATAVSEAKRIVYPLMLKAASGVGGRGMRVWQLQQLTS